MCYSDQLVHKNSAAYDTKDGWVFTGYKGVLAVEMDKKRILVPRPIRAIMSLLLGKKASLEDRNQYDVKEIPVFEYVPPLYGSDLTYKMREPMEDKTRHGFHVAATEQSAQQACYGWRQSHIDFGNILRDLLTVRKSSSGFVDLVVCRVLVPAAAFIESKKDLDDAGHPAWHAHVMLLVPPGERETDEDIEKVSKAGVAWAAKQKPMISNSSGNAEQPYIRRRFGAKRQPSGAGPFVANPNLKCNNLSIMPGAVMFIDEADEEFSYAYANPAQIAGLSPRYSVADKDDDIYGTSVPGLDAVRDQIIATKYAHLSAKSKALLGI